MLICMYDRVFTCTAGGKEVHITLSHVVGGLGLLEREGAAILNAVCMYDRVFNCTAGGKEVHITLSHEVGGLGLLEREGAAILNATLRPLASRAIPAFQRPLRHAGIAARLQLTANGGTLISAEVAQKVLLNPPCFAGCCHRRALCFKIWSCRQLCLFMPAFRKLACAELSLPQEQLWAVVLMPMCCMQLPIATIQSGPVDSLRGAAALTGFSNAIVMDIGEPSNTPLKWCT